MSSQLAKPSEGLITDGVALGVMARRDNRRGTSGVGGGVLKCGRRGEGDERFLVIFAMQWALKWVFGLTEAPEIGQIVHVNKRTNHF